jgi:hypothetical protein
MRRFLSLVEAYRWAAKNAQGDCTLVSVADPYEWDSDDRALLRRYPINFYTRDRREHAN